MVVQDRDFPWKLKSISWNEYEREQAASEDLEVGL